MTTVAGCQLPVAEVASRVSATLPRKIAWQPATGNRQLIAALLLLLAAPAAFACPVCFGNATGPQAEGMNSAILFLLGVVGFVQIGFAAMFIAFWRRGRAARRHRDSFRVIHGG